MAHHFTKAKSQKQDAEKASVAQIVAQNNETLSKLISTERTKLGFNNKNASDYIKSSTSDNAVAQVRQEAYEKTTPLNEGWMGELGSVIVDKVQGAYEFMSSDEGIDRRGVDGSGQEYLTSDNRIQQALDDEIVNRSEQAFQDQNKDLKVFQANQLKLEQQAADSKARLEKIRTQTAKIEAENAINQAEAAARETQRELDLQSYKDSQADLAAEVAKNNEKIRAEQDLSDQVDDMIKVAEKKTKEIQKNLNYQRDAKLLAESEYDAAGKLKVVDTSQGLHHDTSKVVKQKIEDEFKLVNDGVAIVDAEKVLDEVAKERKKKEWEEYKLRSQDRTRENFEDALDTSTAPDTMATNLASIKDAEGKKIAYPNDIHGIGTPIAEQTSNAEELAAEKAKKENEAELYNNQINNPTADDMGRSAEEEAELKAAALQKKMHEIARRNDR